MYYVYEWYIVETNEIIYVGKGTGRRYKVRKHNKFFNDMIIRYNCSSRIVREFEREKDAFEYEFDRILELKKIGQCVCNIYDGGFGGTSSWWTEDDRKKYSEKNVMKSEIQRKRMKEYNPMKNREIAEKTNAKKRKAVIIDDYEYKSIKEVCNNYCVSSSTVIEWCRKGKTANGESCRFKNLDCETYVYKNTGQKRSVTYNGVHYDSATQMARSLGIAQTTASRWCRNGVDPYGKPCCYDDDNRKTIVSMGSKSIPVIVNNKWYPSKESARKDLNISAYTLTQLLDGKLKDEKYICRYGNQQPSRGNTDISTSEGSTTNG